jgi:nitrogen-specific signal transduction histidine kinase
LRILTHAKFVGEIDLVQVMTDSTERLLNLPDRLRSSLPKQPRLRELQLCFGPDTRPPAAWN